MVSLRVTADRRQWLTRQMNAGRHSLRATGELLGLSRSRGGPTPGQRAVAQRLGRSSPAAGSRCHPWPSNSADLRRNRYHRSVQESEGRDQPYVSTARGTCRLIRFIRHGMEHFGSRDCCAFGQESSRHGVHGNFEANSTPLLRSARGGVHRHYAGGNSISLYDSRATSCDAETTINPPRYFRVYRTVESHREVAARWLVSQESPISTAGRKISNTADQRYIEAFAEVHSDRAEGKSQSRSSSGHVKKADVTARSIPGRTKMARCSKRSLQGLGPLTGSNRDLCVILFAPQKTASAKRHAARVSRLLRCCAPTASSKGSPALHRYVFVDAADKS